MFCSQCGQEVVEEARFCQGCGTACYPAAEEVYEENDSNEPIMVLRPKFLGKATALSALPTQIFIAIWGAGFFGIPSGMAIKSMDLSIPLWGPPIVFGMLFFLGIPSIVYFVRKKTYDNTEYRFYKDHLEYTEGFWTAENKNISYRQIVETSMRRGIIQRKYGLGTIYLATPATGENPGKSSSGIRVRDIKNPEEVYETVQKLIGK
jgi:membrane protein YdbS with pleckstrin-like domain